MRKFVSLISILLLAVLHAPTQAQALLFFDLLPPDLFPTNEPVILLLTGIALLGLARVGVQRRGPGETDTALVDTSSRVTATDRSTRSKRAAA